MGSPLLWYAEKTLNLGTLNTRRSRLRHPAGPGANLGPRPTGATLNTNLRPAIPPPSPPNSAPLHRPPPGHIGRPLRTLAAKPHHRPLSHHPRTRAKPEYRPAAQAARHRPGSRPHHPANPLSATRAGLHPRLQPRPNGRRTRRQSPRRPSQTPPATQHPTTPAAPRLMQQQNKSLFASFSSEKEESFFLVLF